MSVHEIEGTHQPGESREQRRDRQLAAIIRKGQEEFGRLLRAKRPSGLAVGQFTVPDKFDAPLPEGVLRLFEESEIEPQNVNTMP